MIKMNGKCHNVSENCEVVFGQGGGKPSLFQAPQGQLIVASSMV